MKKITSVLLLVASSIAACTSPVVEPTDGWMVEEPVEESSAEQPASDSNADPNGERYREVWDIQHRQVTTGDVQAQPIGGVRIRIDWPTIAGPRHEMPFVPHWMIPSKTETRWLIVSFPNSPDPRPRRFNFKWDRSYSQPSPYVHPWVHGSLIADTGSFLSLRLTDLTKESRLPWDEDIHNFDEISLRLEVPSMGHYWEETCVRGEDNYNTTTQYHHFIRCQISPDSVSAGTEWVQLPRGGWR